MESVQSYVTTSLVIVVVVGLLVSIRYLRQAIVSNRRMFRMMLTCGIDEATARNPDQLLDVDMQLARRRCRRCPAPEKCDRWLSGEAIPCNDFCPNAARFMAAAENRLYHTACDPARRPGRRLDSR